MANKEQTAISETRRAFFKDPATDLTDLRETVAKSWIRSWKHKINPNRADFGRLDSENYLASHVTKERPILFSYIFSCVESLYNSNDFSDMVLLLTDASGRIINLYGSKADLARLSALGLAEECTLRENSAGTNAIGTSLYVREPTYICWNEHYNNKLCSFISYSAPIFDHTNKLVAALGALSLRPAVTPLLLSLFTATASNIYKECGIYHQTLALRNQTNNLDTLINTMNDGIVFLDARGNIVHTNSVARYFLLMYEYELIGRHISDFISPEDIDFSTLTNNIYDHDVTIHSGNIKKFCFQASVHLTRTCEGKTNYLLILRKPKSSIHESGDNDHTAKWRFNDIIGTSPALTEAINLAHIASKTNCTVLITGESGTGKELFAQAIHNESKCASGPFIAVNCGAIPKELIESELFGYESGAFTGAKKNGSPGKFELANGGTIFLDEIGDMSFDLQVCLLRFLQEQEITRIGGKKPIKLNVRVIAATNKNLEEAINNGVFRMDLYYRLNVFSLHVPPLRERTGDVRNLSHCFLQKYKTASNQAFLGFTPEALDALEAYNWPGNVRELENVIERAVIISRSDRIRLDDLPEKLRTGHVLYPSSAIRYLDADKQPPAAEYVSMNREEMEKNALIHALQSASGNVTRAAEIMGISRRTFYRKMKKYQIF